jgi:hypothetical protein
MTNTNFIPDEIKKNELRNACHHSTWNLSMFPTQEFNIEIHKITTFILFYISVKPIFHIKGKTQTESVWMNNYKLWPNKMSHDIILNDRIPQNVLISKSYKASTKSAHRESHYLDSK